MWTSESAGRALETASTTEWDALLGDGAFLVHVDPEVLRRVVPVSYRPRSGPVGKVLDVYRSVAHRLTVLDPAGRAQLLSLQATRFGVEDCFTSAVEPGMWSCVWSGTGSTPHGLRAQWPQPNSVAVAAGCWDGRPMAVTGDIDDAALRVWDLSNGTQIGQPLVGHSPDFIGGVASVALLAGAGNPIAVSAGEDRTVRCWDLLRMQQIGDALDCSGEKDLALAAVRVDGAPLVLVGGDDALHVWVNRGHWERLGPALPHSSPVWAVATAQVDGVPVAVTGCVDGTLRVWDLARYEPVGTPLHGHVGSIDAITTVELDGHAVALTVGADQVVRIWDLHDRCAIGQVPLDGTTNVSRLAAIPRDFGWDVLVRSAPPGWPSDTVSRFVLPDSYRARGGAIVATPTLICGSDIAVADVDGCRVAVAVGAREGDIQLWDLDAATLSESAGHRDEVNAVVTARIADVPVLLTGGADGTVQAWDRSTGTPAARPLKAITDGAVNDLAVVDFGGRNVLVTCHSEVEIRVWDLAAGHLLTELKADGISVRGVDTIHIDNQPVVVSAGSWRTQVWDLASARELETQFDIRGDSCEAVATTRVKGRPVAVTAAPRGEVVIWDIESSRTTGLVGHRGDAYAVTAGEFDGVPLALTGAGASRRTRADVRLWNLDTRQCLVQFEPGHYVWAIALARIGTRTIAFTGGEDGAVHAWDCSSGRPLATLHLPERVNAMTWDDDRLAVCFGNETAAFTLQL